MVDISAYVRGGKGKTKPPEPALPPPGVPLPSFPVPIPMAPAPPPAPATVAPEALASLIAAEVAEASRRALVASVGRVASRIGGLRWAITLAALWGALAFGYAAGWYNAARIDGHAIPPGLSSVFGAQDWAGQWAACRKQPAINGIEWCLMPMVTKPAKLPN